MSIIYGEIESLKTLKNELIEKGIDRFDSISEINSFLEKFEDEKLWIIDKKKKEINDFVISTREQIKNKKEELEVLRTELREETNNSVQSIDKKIERIEYNNSNHIFNVLKNYRVRRLKRKINSINEKFNKDIHRTTKRIEVEIVKSQTSIDNIFNNKEIELSKRSKNEIDRLEYIYSTLKELYPRIAGVIGENKVVKEIEKLSDEYILINDFNLEFNKPIYNKQTNDRIYSIQIDHLLISPAGLFIIETKNWSNKSLQNYDLRSPVEQIKRTNYALFIFLNILCDDCNRIGKHHWGESQIPVKNLIVMINNKPKGIFKFVKVLKLSELTQYVERFDKIFSSNDINLLAKILLKYLKI